MNREIYEKNLDILKTNYKSLYIEYLDLINEEPEIPDTLVDFEHVDGKRGIPTFLLRRKSDGKTIHGHSIFDPMKEAEKKLDQFEFSDNERIIQLGFGFGYEIRAFLTRIQHKYIVAVEPFFGVFRHAMENLDLTDIFRPGRVVVVLKPTPERMKYMFTLETGHMSMPSFAVNTIPHVEFDPSLTGAVSATIKQIETFFHLNFNTAVTASAIFQRNTMLNFSNSLEMPGIASIAGKFAGRPVFVVAPGPSLEKNGALLKQVMGKELIIACDTATKPLQRMGVTPDIIASIDFQTLNFYKLRGVDASSSVLAISLDSSYLTQRNHRGRQFNYFHIKDHCDLFKDLFGDKGYIATGGSVLTDAFMIAKLAGADPLIFVGVDLGFPGGKFYSSGSFDNGESTKLISEGKLDLIEIDDVFGNKIYTYQSFYEFLTWLGNNIKMNRDRTYIDSTEGGARISGTEIIPLNESIEKYARQDRISPSETLDEIFKTHTPPKKEFLLTTISEYIKDFSNMSKAARETVKIAKRAKSEINRSANLETNSSIVRDLKTINKKRKIFQESAKTAQMSFVSTLINRQTAAAIYYSEDESLSKKESYSKLVDIEIECFSGIEKSCSAMASHFELLKHSIELEAGNEYV